MGEGNEPLHFKGHNSVELTTIDLIYVELLLHRPIILLLNREQFHI